MLRRVCVYCGSSAGVDTRYAATATALGRELARRGIDLVYGAGKVGIMGAIADAVLAGGGSVIGVIPRMMVDLDLAHAELPDLRVVDSMHERKALMASLADAFIALPGGIGTLEELSEIMTWRQLELHHKPIGLVNDGGYYDDLVAFLDRAVAEDFLRSTHREMLIVDSDARRLVERLSSSIQQA